MDREGSSPETEQTTQTQVSRRTFLKLSATSTPTVLPLLAAEDPGLTDPGIGFILTEAERQRAAEVMQRVFEHFLGEWVGVREGEDTGNQGFVPSRRRYYVAQGGPQVWCLVSGGATVDETPFFVTSQLDENSFLAAKAMFYSPARDNVLTYFLENGGNVQIFELDKEATNPTRLVWQEILRPQNLFRVVESIVDNDRLVITIYRQDDAGRYQVYARGASQRQPA